MTCCQTGAQEADGGNVSRTSKEALLLEKKILDSRAGFDGIGGVGDMQFYGLP